MNDRELRRFHSRVDIKPGVECFIWNAARTSAGYGEMRFNGKQHYAHRLAWQHYRGPISPGLCVLHKCDNPPCVNPDHLFLGTKQDNVTDMMSKGRQRMDSTAGRIGWSKKAASMTSCRRGHPWPESLGKHVNGRRFCRPCNVAAQAAWRARQK